MESDIIILGGSLAGMACAITLKQLGYNPLVLEKSHFPRKKLCGEFLGPDALAALQTLGILEHIQAIAFGPVEHTHFYNRNGQGVQIRHAWMDKRFPYGLALSREILDNALVEHARAIGVTVLEGQRVLSPVIRLGQPQAGFQIRVIGRGMAAKTSESIFNAPWLVDATGRNGKLTLASELNLETPSRLPQQNSRVGIQCHVHLNHPLPGKDLHMFLFSGGYGGLQPIGKDVANLCMLVDAPLSKVMHAPFSDFISATIGQNPAALEILLDSQLADSFCTTADLNLAGEVNASKPSHKDETLLRIGDACVTVDPFTGSGMAHALETGQLAAQCMHQALCEGGDYQAMIGHYRALYAHRFKARLQWMRYFRPFLENGRAQACVWPILPPFLPWLAKNLR